MTPFTTTPRPLFRVFLAMLLLTATGCIEIREEYFIRSDGSGSFRLTFDFSAFNDLQGMDSGPAAAASGQTEEMEDDFVEIDSSLQGVTARLRQISGLSNVQVSQPRKGAANPDLRLSIRFDFADLDALAEGLESLKRDLAENADSLGGVEEQFRLEDGHFSRRSASPLLTEKMWNKGGAAEKPANEQENADAEASSKPSMMDDEKMAKLTGSLFTYRVNYTFEGAIQNSSYEQGRKSLDGRTLELATSITGLKENPSMLSGSIALE